MPLLCPLRVPNKSCVPCLGGVRLSPQALSPSGALPPLLWSCPGPSQPWAAFHGPLPECPPLLPTADRDEAQGSEVTSQAYIRPGLLGLLAPLQQPGQPVWGGGIQAEAMLSPFSLPEDHWTGVGGALEWPRDGVELGLGPWPGLLALGLWQSLTLSWPHTFQRE